MGLTGLGVLRFLVVFDPLQRGNLGIKRGQALLGSLARL